MRYLLITLLLVSPLAFSEEGEPLPEVDVILDCYPDPEPCDGLAEREEEEDNKSGTDRVANSYNSSRSNNRKSNTVAERADQSKERVDGGWNRGDETQPQIRQAEERVDGGWNRGDETQPQIRQAEEEEVPPMEAAVSPNSQGACCLQNGRCRGEATVKQCTGWRGTFHMDESCPVDCQ